MQDMIAGFAAAPLWAQIAMGLFALIVVVTMVEPGVRRRRFRRRLDDLARELGQAPPTGRGWPAAFPIDAHGRAFEIEGDLRGSSRGGSYRGPHGYLLSTVTELAGTRWPKHQVDINRAEGRLARLLRGTRATGDPAFDARFMVTEDGFPVRDGWLDATMRQAIMAFFDGVPVPGLIWIHEGELQYLMQSPWTGLDGPALLALLQRQAVLASALERTAGGRD